LRTIMNLNSQWAFSKTATAVPAEIDNSWEIVNLPHTWNAIDGQDGGNDYHRGTCYYAKRLNKSKLPTGEMYFLELCGANSSADVYMDGKHLAHHDGGYSTWRVNLTEHLTGECLLVVAVDNAPNDRVYPQMADFTFYGGLYRDVNLIVVPEAHFDLEHYGTPGIRVTPIVRGANANVEVEVFVTGAAGKLIRYALMDKEGKLVAETTAEDTKVRFTVENVRKWQGRKDPYLYTAKAELLDKGVAIDTVSTRFGCRSYVIDPNKGFVLNGEEYPLRGVSRHQDRWQKGNALSREDHAEDVALICQVGATTVRLAHYQHDRYFYDLCDEAGLVIWAEIPYISQHLPNGRENTISQMKELIIQNYNHPCIVVWGLSNEITMKGADDPDLIDNHRVLNKLVHRMDNTRLTTLAAVSMCPMDAEYLQIPDCVAYNHYFGWYGGETSMNGPWFDKFHTMHPDLPVGISEYGCEALNWHTSDPKQGDYTEEYQAYYHEELIKCIHERPYLWATYVWNMFDFGADARAEGGENGQNHKGLITIDRKYKKDAFFAYKAWLNPEPMVHICGKRYVDRVEDMTKVTVYSNCERVELFADGESLGVQKHNGLPFFYFDVPNKGETKLVAVAGELKDESVIKKVDTFHEAYLLKEKGAVLNWFDIKAPEGYLSLNSKISEITKTLRGKMLLGKLFMKLKKEMSGGAEASGFEITEDMMQMMNGFTLLRLTGLLGMLNISFTKEELLKLNKKLNRIKVKR